MEKVRKKRRTHPEVDYEADPRLMVSPDLSLRWFKHIFINPSQSWIRIITTIAVVVSPALLSVTLFISLQNYLLGVPRGDDIILRFEGSETIGNELLPGLASAYLRETGAVDINYVDKRLPREGWVIGSRQERDVGIHIRSSGSSNAFQCLKERTCDIGMASRPINQEERRELLNSGMGDLRSPKNEHMIALDAVLIIVSRLNPVDSLSIINLTRILTGNVRNWNELDEHLPDHTIDVYSTIENMSRLVDENILSSDVKEMEIDLDVSTRVSKNINALGIVSLPNAGFSKSVKIYDGNSEALAPSRFAISTEDYSLSRRLFLYTPDSASSTARQFIQFVASPASQRVVDAMGFVPRTLVINAPTQEVQLPFNIRFLTGSTILDAKAEGDLGQLVNQLARLELQGLEVHLIGYTDETGLSETNMILSESRAEAVGRELLARGVRQSIITEGLGTSNPVASNQTEEGRARNRRTEIWVRTKQ